MTRHSDSKAGEPRSGGKPSVGEALSGGRKAGLPLAGALDRADFGVALTDGEGHVAWCNPLVTECYLSPESARQWQGRPARAVLAPLFAAEDWDRIEAGLGRLGASATGRVEIGGLTLALGERARRAIDLVLADLGSASTDPRPGWTAWFFYDVTRLRQADESLQALLRHSYDGIFMIDGECKIRVFNQACERVTGWTAGEALDRDGACRDIFGCNVSRCGRACAAEDIAADPMAGLEPESEESVKEFCFRQVEQGELTLERPIRARDGARKWVEFSYAPVMDDNGHVTHVLGFVRDVSHRRQLEDQLRLTRKLATLGELAGAMTHEIKNPLGIILSAAEIVGNPDRPEDQKRLAAGFIRQEARRLDERLQAFLKFSRPRQPEFVVQSVHRVLTQTIIAYRTLARPGLTLETGFGKGLPRARIDPDQMQQVFLNLIINADQAMPNGGKISISTRSDERGDIEIEVADEGPGIGAEQAERLFEPFFSTKPKGTGLGLSIVMQIVGAHRGRVEADNRPGGGARFRVVLPAVAGEVEAGSRNETTSGKRP